MSTKNRLPLIIPENAVQIHNIIKECFTNQSLKVESINGTADHVHILFYTNGYLSIIETIENANKESELLINSIIYKAKSFQWDKEILLFSVSQSQIELVTNYISRQKEIHSRKLFLKEKEELMHAHNVN